MDSYRKGETRGSEGAVRFLSTKLNGKLARNISETDFDLEKPPKIWFR